jgi:hypothetical protein
VGCSEPGCKACSSIPCAIVPLVLHNCISMLTFLYYSAWRWGASRQRALGPVTLCKSRLRSGVARWDPLQEMLDGDDLPAAASGDDDPDDLEKYLSGLNDPHAGVGDVAGGEQVEGSCSDDLANYLGDLVVEDETVDVDVESPAPPAEKD